MTIVIVNEAKAQPMTVGIIMGKNKILDYGPDPLLVACGLFVHMIPPNECANGIERYDGAA